VELTGKVEEVKKDELSAEAKAQHDKGKLTAWERLELLLDPGSFTELGALATSPSHDFGMQEKKQPRDGVVTGWGKVDGRQVFVYAQDFTFMGASMGEMHTRKVAHVIKLAMETGTPMVGLLDSGGARIQEGIDGLDGGGEIFLRNTLASGLVPQISAIMGPCAGIAVYSPAITDFVLMTDKTATMFITGPNVIKNVTGEEIEPEELGGASVHNSKSGVAHFFCHDEASTLSTIRALLSYLPASCDAAPPRGDTSDPPDRPNDPLEKVVPAKSTMVYNVKSVLKEVLDKGSFLEIHERFARNVVVGLGRLHGHSVGIVANQPMHLAGCIDIGASDKIARFVHFCDAFNIPLVNFVDVTGFLPGSSQEHGGIIRHGAKVLFAYSQASVPKISLVMRKAYGGAYIALVSKDMGYDKVVAWPTAEIAVMGASQAVAIVSRKELSAPGAAPELRERRIREFHERFCSPDVAASKNKVDMVVQPRETRKTLVALLEMLLPKVRPGRNPDLGRFPKKHGSTPL